MKELYHIRKKGAFRCISGCLLFEILVFLVADFRKRTAAALRIAAVAEIASEEDHLMMGFDPSFFGNFPLELALNRIDIILCIGKPESFGNS